MSELLCLVRIDIVENSRQVVGVTITILFPHIILNGLRYETYRRQNVNVTLELNPILIEVYAVQHSMLQCPI